MLRKRWKWTLAIGMVGLLLVLAAPSFVGSKWGYEPLIRAFAQDRLHLQVGQVKLGWFRPIEITDIVLSDLGGTQDPLLPTSSSLPSAPSANRPLLTIDSLRADRGLLGFLLGGRKLGRIEIIAPRMDISLLEDGSNLERLIQSLQRSQQDDAPNSSSAPASRPKFDLQIAIRSASVHVERAGVEGPLVVVPPFDVTAEYLGVGEDPHVIVEPTTLLHEVELTQELVRLGIGKAVPLLAKSAWFDGRVSLSSERMDIPLEHPVDSKGKASIVLHQVRTGPSEPMIIDAIEFIARLRNKPAALELVFVDGSQIEVAIQDRRVFHSGLEAGLPKVDERLQFSSSGSVGIEDRSLDMTLLVPVPVEQIAMRDKVKELGVPRLRVPVGGTLDQPQVDWNLMRKDSGLVLAMMAGQLEGDAPILSNIVGSLGNVAEGQADEAIAAAAEMLKSIRDRRKQSSGDAKKTAESPTSAEESASKRPLLDALRKAVRPR